MSERVSPARLGLALAVSVAIAVAGCGGSGAAHSSSPTAGTNTSFAGAGGDHTSSTTASTAHTAARRPHHARIVHGAAVGTTQDVHAYGAALHVTATSVSAVGRRDALVPPGDRGVAVRVRIANVGGVTYDSTASGDWSVIVSAGLSVPLSVRSGPCQTPLVDFESFVVSGTVRPGCVAFSVPDRARVLGVRFSPHAHAHGSVTWRVKQR